uniref:nickel ABC transporter permease n=1 Tax=Lachnospira sp. TaxID=2049031 RepID=UPI003FEEEB64
MKRFIKKRLLQLVPVLIGITFLSFVLVNMSNTDAIDMLEANRGTAMTEVEKQELREELGLNKPVITRYFIWLKNTFTGDMGNSYVSGKSVFSTFVSKLPATVYLCVVSMGLTLIISVPLGIISAVNKNKWLDYIIRVVSLIGNSLPNFFLALLLIYVFALKLNWLPVMGNRAGAKSVILPSVTLAVAMSSRYISQIRTAVINELDKPYVNGARARGVSEGTILIRSVLKSAMLTVSTLLALSAGSLLGGTAIVESIFMWDGVGKMAVDAITMRDYPIIQVYVIWMAVIYVIVNLITDIGYHYLNPKIRVAGTDEA